MEDNSVLYATAAPALLGVAAVVVCVLYRYRMRSSNRLSLADQLHREVRKWVRVKGWWTGWSACGLARVHG